MLVENKKDSGRWPGCLTQRNWDFINNIQAKVKITKRYSKEIQSFCKTSCFGAVPNGGIIDKEPLDEIVKVASSKAPLFSSMVFADGPACHTSALHLITMKLIAILIILCRLVHQNNSNYLPLFIALYFYSLGAYVNAITLLNHLGLSVLYDVLQKKLNDITSSSVT